MHQKWTLQMFWSKYHSGTSNYFSMMCILICSLCPCSKFLHLMVQKWRKKNARMKPLLLRRARDYWNKGMMELPIIVEKEDAERERPDTQYCCCPNTTGHSFASRHNTPHSWVLAAILLLFPPPIPRSPFKMGERNEWGGLKLNSGFAPTVWSIRH